MQQLPEDQRPTIGLASDLGPGSVESAPPPALHSDRPPLDAAAPPPPPPASLVPAGGVIYKVDSSRSSLAELCRDGSVLLAPIYLLTKLTRTRLPGSVNDPNVAALRPFEVERSAIPADALSRLDLTVAELSAVGFDASAAVYHAIIDLFNNSRNYVVTLPHPADGRAIGRAHLRLEGTTVPPKTHHFCDILSETDDGAILWSTTAKSTLNTPEGISIRRHVGAAPAGLWAEHQQWLREQRRPVLRSGITRDNAIDFAERHHARLRDFHLARGVFQPMSDLDR
jgi:hypothetical protein